MTAAVKARKRSARSGPATSRAEYVEARIREAIQDGRYQPGARLRETEIAERLKVSRTPVREALRRLESEGLLGFVPWRGVVVAQLDRRQVMELYAMRAILEGAAAGLAARQVQPAEIDLLAALGGGKVLAMEVKADAAPGRAAWRPDPDPRSRSGSPGPPRLRPSPACARRPARRRAPGARRRPREQRPAG